MKASQEDKDNMLLATEETQGRSHKMEKFNYKGQWVNA